MIIPIDHILYDNFINQFPNSNPDTEESLQATWKTSTGTSRPDPLKATRRHLGASKVRDFSAFAKQDAELLQIWQPVVRAKAKASYKEFTIYCPRYLIPAFLGRGRLRA